jgi:hypothetical protein
MSSTSASKHRSEADGWIAGIGLLIGVIAWLVTFLAVYVAAVDSAGWVVGIALGWIPATMAGGVAFFLFRYLWWAIALVVAYFALRLHGV